MSKLERDNIAKFYGVNIDSNFNSTLGPEIENTSLINISTSNTGTHGNKFYTQGGAMICPTGNTQGTTHLCSNIFREYLKEITSRWRRRQKKNCALIILHDGATSHKAIEGLNESNIFLFKFEAGLTPYCCLLDQVFFSPLKNTVKNTWQLGYYNSLLCPLVKKKINSIQYGSPFQFESMGFNCGVDFGIVPYHRLDKRLCGHITRESYMRQTKMNAVSLEEDLEGNRDRAGLIDEKFNQICDGLTLTEDTIIDDIET